MTFRLWPVIRDLVAPKVLCRNHTLWYVEGGDSCDGQAMPAEPIPPEDRKLYEEKGEDYVRSTWGSGAARIPSARAWLAEIDEARRKADEARQAKVEQQSQSTLWAAWIAAGAVIVAVVIGILAWVFPLH
jgi:hypothetical protein